MDGSYSIEVERNRALELSDRHPPWLLPLDSDWIRILTAAAVLTDPPSPFHTLSLRLRTFAAPPARACDRLSLRASASRTGATFR